MAAAEKGLEDYPHFTWLNQTLGLAYGHLGDALLTLKNFQEAEQSLAGLRDAGASVLYVQADIGDDSSADRHGDVHSNSHGD